ncbi:uncharacterized protein EV422DRAFT_56568 [Fimicolochytrium jonesii]|uniref:uncharacterized protein n=1 Tax=Fimicolochytrium jonesii TaxID=1396493 RepID=UPI0022FE522B|nr:uncharacterized protein EV422DRAFT_56568 [Fimicolochytrium jonesii]KAI8821168.1 hypothetical protein EV422DRAFT_56568 [Fimicolochytrium jonesii]
MDGTSWKSPFFICVVIVAVISIILCVGGFVWALKAWGGASGGGLRHPFRYLSLLTVVFAITGQILNVVASAIGVVCVRDLRCQQWTFDSVWSAYWWTTAASNFGSDFGGGLYFLTLVERFDMFIPVLGWSTKIVPGLRIWAMCISVLGYTGHFLLWVPYMVDHPTLRWAFGSFLYIHWLAIIVVDASLTIIMVHTFRQIHRDLPQWSTASDQPVLSKHGDSITASATSAMTGQSKELQEPVNVHALGRELIVIVTALVVLDTTALLMQMMPVLGFLEDTGDELALLTGSAVCIHFLVAFFFLSKFSKSLLQRRPR